MKFFAPTIAALAATQPSIPVVQAWSLGPSSFFTSPMVVTSPSSILRRQQALMDRALQQQMGRPSSSPRYEITDDEETFQLAVDVPGVKMEDIDVQLEDNILTVSGHRESSDTTYSFTSKFSQSFSLDPTVDIDNFSASLENGVLVVSAPKDMKKIEANIRKIPIAAAHPPSKKIAAEKDHPDTGGAADEKSAKDDATIKADNVVESAGKEAQPAV